MWRALLSCHGVLNGQQVKNLNGKGASGVRVAVPFQDGDDDGIGWFCYAVTRPAEPISETRARPMAAVAF